MEKNIITLAIETSCDETSCAVLRGGREVLSNVISSQIEIHRKFGGVVPEVASRKHIESINSIIQQALDEAKIGFSDVDIVGVTRGPGLVGALLVGISSAKAIAYGLNVPLVGVNHIEGHICANYITHSDLKPPFTCLVVSGGHTYLVQANSYTDYEMIGRTRDDAAGEAFDKVARSLGLPYPGGPLIDKMSYEGNRKAIDFPRPCLDEKGYDFSFSGLKTAVLNYLNHAKQMGEEIVVEDVAASFQQAAIEVLVEKSIKLALERKSKTIVLAGGVAANTGLRNLLESRGKEEGIEIKYPSTILCTDNAAMIGSAAYFNYIDGFTSNFDLNVEPNLELGVK
ncbi:tRNA (adenosine(37)-N6)-threonylcarbamoyltransferase complex transferase subunit TsaD [Anaerosalibacter sp. Marseille-P3206]|uniref:tRNA (adenosine(37)-N6)-threonylcarbamoyltransferase complex transferase subunit TsaD n=1 Tax=Anaerosalibacter sp. Marseille-P3206 TaxID=1871005 RepID=UPI0009871CBD|nr:tRNA (adenosine(37)-N6)-threonylcarbamoyltransferase complex transferase subunit TsaD [Anaerosalibacter sp. Marseille-P3206]